MRGMSRLIRMAGEPYELVGEAYDGREALELLAKCRPDTCITDIRMPCMDGLELIRAARSRGYRTRFIIVSAYEEFDFARQAVSLGVEDYLVKPVMEEELKRLLLSIEQGRKGMILPAAQDSLLEEYREVHPLVRKMLRVIETSYSVKISLKEMAERFGVTQEYLSTLFSQNIGQGFARFVKSYRIARAKELLRAGCTPEETAQRCGIENVKYFSSVFRDETGMTVTEFLREDDVM